MSFALAADNSNSNENIQNADMNAANSSFNSTLKLGVQGEEVAKLQKWLKEHGYYGGEIDGNFGNYTEEAVKSFQKDANLLVDGSVGPITLAAMERWNYAKSTDNKNNSEEYSTSKSSYTKKKASYTKKKTKARATHRSTYSRGGGIGDCWTNSAYLYGKLTKSGVTARIIQYRTNQSSRHRSIQVYKNGAWVDYNYKANGYAKRYYATKKKPGMKVL